MILVSDNTFDNNLVLMKRVNYNISDHHVNYFDNDGFELTILEQNYYKANGIELSNIQNHAGDQRVWFTCSDEKFRIDHSTLLHRRSFDGDARSQLEAQVDEIPQLHKLLNLKPKWGLDFALEYYGEGRFIEVLHFEMDYRSYDDAIMAKAWFENKILSTNWNSFVEFLKQTEHEWKYLRGMEQNDWKARQWGLFKAEETYKTWSN
jgi:hypothetical protein